MNFFSSFIYSTSFLIIFSLSACTNANSENNTTVLTLLKNIENDLLSKPTLDIKLFESRIKFALVKSNNGLKLQVDNNEIKKSKYFSSIYYAYFNPKKPSEGGLLGLVFRQSQCITPYEISSEFGDIKQEREGYDYYGEIETSIGFEKMKSGSFYFKHNKNDVFDIKKSCLKNVVFLVKGLEQHESVYLDKIDDEKTFTPKVDILHIAPTPAKD